jgi:hypothetical protein
MFCASVAFRPETRASSGAEAVLTSTPTAFTQSSTTASSERASARWSTSCWYWPTPIALGSIFTSSASGSCRRRAIDTAPRRLTSSFREFLRRQFDAEYTEAPASLTTILVSRASGMPLHQIGRQLVGLAAGGAVADGDQLDAVLASRARQHVQRAVPVAARLVRIDGRGVEQLAGGVDHRDLARRCGCPGRGRW